MQSGHGEINYTIINSLGVCQLAYPHFFNNKVQISKHKSLWCNTEPICLYPSAVSIAVRLNANESHLSTNPVSLAHFEGFTCRLIFFPVSAIKELAYTVFHHHLHVYVNVEAWFLVDFILRCWFEYGNLLHRLMFSLICIFTSRAQKKEFPSYPFHY